MILVSGCSYVEKQDWPTYLFGKNVIQAGHGGACNWIISESVLKKINCDTDFVYVQFSGVNRMSIPVTTEFAKTISQKLVKIRTGRKTWIVSGGFHASWMNYKHHSSHYYKIFKNYYSGLPKNLLKMHTEYSLYHVIHCLNFLEKKNIKYCFGWMYDFFKSDITTGQGIMDKTNSLYNEVPWHKFINIFPFDTAQKHNELLSDKVHPTSKGYEIWCDLVKDQIYKFYQ